MAATYHLAHDFGISKATLKRKFTVWYGDRRDEDSDRARSLLARHTQRYTLEEVELLAGYYLSAHDECVLDNSEEHTPLEVYNAEQAQAKFDAAWKRIRAARKEEGR